jgi:hypothetical protein
MAENLIPNVVVQVVATLSGTIVSVGVPLILSKMSKISKLQTTIFGVDDVDDMSGLVGAVESHDKEISDHSDRIQELTEGQMEIRQGQETIANRIEKLHESISNRSDIPEIDDDSHE